MYLWHLWASSLAIFYSISCLIWTFAVRFTLQAYFLSVHAAGLGFFAGLVLWLECASPWLLNRLLPICSLPPWSHKRMARCVGLVITLILLLLQLLNATIFTALTLAESNFDSDRFIATCFYWGAALLLLFKLLVIHRRQREKRNSRLGLMHTRDRAAAVIGMHLHLVWDDDLHRPGGSGIYVLKDSRKRRKDLLMRYGITTLIFASFVIYTILLFGVTVNEAMVTHDRRLFPTRNVTRSVQPSGHRTHRVHLRCVGNGNITVLLEHDMGRSALLGLPFLPEVLANSPKYRTCVYDRRGYGWSDGREFDWFAMFSPNCDIDHEFLPSLIEAGLLKVPLLYVGHGYGAKYVLNHGMKFPHYFRGAVLLDWFSFVKKSSSQLEQLRALARKYFMWSNLLPTGWLRVVWSLKNFGLSSWLGYDFKEVPSRIKEELKTAALQGRLFEPTMHEANFWLSTNRSAWGKMAEKLNKIVPVLALDRQGNDGKCSYSCRRLRSAKSTDDIVYTMNGATEVAELMDEFVSAALRDR